MVQYSHLKDIYITYDYTLLISIQYVYSLVQYYS